jgi:dolichol-phosphate mannosyltransferase
LTVAQGLAAADPVVRVVNLLRNFGHQAAVTAGLDLAQGDIVVLIDADLQDPPELIGAMAAEWLQGADVAYGRRRRRAGETGLKLLTAGTFYRLLRHLTKTQIPEDTGDFRLMDRRVVEALRGMREQHRFIRGMVAWVGGKQVPVYYDRRARYAGTTHYPYAKMISFAIDAITSFSVVPLRLVTYLALAILVLALLATLVVFVVKLLHPDFFIPGFAATLMTIIFFGGVQLLALGVIGEYIGRMYEAVKARPIYIVEGVYGGGTRSDPPARS